MLARRAALALSVALAAGCTDPQPCPSPLEACSGQCVDIQSDRRHCGGCGIGCPTGEACVDAACDPDPTAACHVRTGGAFVTLGHCGDVVKLWVESPDFVTRASRTSPPPGVPVLAVRLGSDCDGQWSWHVDETAASFADAPPSSTCNVCPDVVQADAIDGFLSVTSWCPAAAVVLSVDSR